MRKTLMKYLIPFVVILVALAVGLSFVTPWAPVFVLASVLIQVPIIWRMFSSSQDNGYDTREQERVVQFEIDGDAALWLEAEEREAASIGYRYYSKANRDRNRLNRANMLVKLNRAGEAKELLEEMDPKKLNRGNLLRYNDAMVGINEGESSGVSNESMDTCQSM